MLGRNSYAHSGTDSLIGLVSWVIGYQGCVFSGDNTRKRTFGHWARTRACAKLSPNKIFQLTKNTGGSTQKEACVSLGMAWSTLRITIQNNLCILWYKKSPSQRCGNLDSRSPCSISTVQPKLTSSSLGVSHFQRNRAHPPPFQQSYPLCGEYARFLSKEQVHRIPKEYQGVPSNPLKDLYCEVCCNHSSSRFLVSQTIQQLKCQS